MELRSRVFKVALATAIGLFAVITAQEESAAEEYRYLCTSVPSACDYAPSTAPGLIADVCWDGSSAYLMGPGGCAQGQWSYSIKNGEVVDPLTNEVQAYVPLDDACDAGFCETKPVNAGTTQPGPICCSANGCVAVQYSECTGEGKVFLWCADGEEPQQQQGTWKCYSGE